MVTIKEYAESRGKSVQSVYKQMRSKENAAALNGHIIIQKFNNKDVKFLDDEAVRVLDAASSQSVQVIELSNDKEQIETLKQEKEALLLKIAELQDQLIKKNEKIDQLKDEKIAYLENKEDWKSLPLLQRVFPKR